MRTRRRRRSPELTNGRQDRCSIHYLCCCNSGQQQQQSAAPPPPISTHANHLKQETIHMAKCCMSCHPTTDVAHRNMRHSSNIELQQDANNIPPTKVNTQLEKNNNFYMTNILVAKSSNKEKTFLLVKDTINTIQLQRKHSHLPETFVTILYLGTLLFTLGFVTQDLAQKHNLRLTLQNLPLLQTVDCQRIFNTYQLQQPAFPLPIPNRQANLVPQHITPPSASRSHLPDVVANQGGVIKDKNVTLTKQFNPIVITNDIIIKRDAKLIIESGTELLFDKKKGIIVHGSLEILGNINDKVKLNLLKSQHSATINFRSQNNNQQLQQVRLVDGDYPNEGRVQIKFNDRWHSVCTNSKNLTAADIKVLCYQVGYQDGYWYKWFPRRNDTTFQLMSKSFHCSGKETAITQCLRWNRIRAGGGVCNSHSDFGIKCSKELVFGSSENVASYDYWRGLEFVNSEIAMEYMLDGQMKQKVSRSRLNHVTISEAGLNEVGNATAAIRVYGQPPRLNDIEIKNSIYGIVIEEADDAMKFDNIRLINNMNFPLFINTSWGKVSMNGMHVENNGGDGIRVVRHERLHVGSHDFCKFANLGTSQSYPVILSHEQQFLTTGRDCCQEFISQNQLTVHFSVLRSTPNNLLPEGDVNRRVSVPNGVNLGKDAYLVIHDDYHDEFPFRLQIQNGTRAQSIVSRSGRLKICYEPASYRTVLFTIEIVADSDDEGFTGIAHDLVITNSYIRRNEGRGLWVDNPRSGVKLINVTVVEHNHLSGIHVENGTGEVIVRSSLISNNTGHGLYINLAGGYYHIDNSTISDNSLKGIAVEYDKRPELVPFNHTMHLGYSLVAKNGENGLFIGNVCRSDAFWNISMTSFIKNVEDAIVFQSCLPTLETVAKFNNLTSRLNLSDHDSSYHNNYQELYITHNVFLANHRRAIYMAPVSFIKSFVRHNLFKDHPLAVIYINNQAYQDRFENHFGLAPVNIRIASNRFYANRGRYVANIGLLEDSPKQTLIFTKNYLEDNLINEPYIDLKPRSRVSAVVVVSSTNTKVIKNRFDNPQSSFEMGAHLEAHSKIINATANFWGHRLDAATIYRRIFDRKNRYNLAQIEFLQYLISPDDLEYITDLSFDRERDKITTFRNGTRLGGEIKGFEELNADTYIVQEDLFIRSGGHLVLKPGTVLKFQDGVGMMVQGRFDALGKAASHILLTSLSSSLTSNRIPQRVSISTTTQAPFAESWVSHQLDGGLDNEHESSVMTHNQFNNSSSYSHLPKTINKRQAPTNSLSNVRLSHTTMGRLEVQLDGVWGPVCDYNFDINDAAVACQQLGMILNKDDWLLERYQYAASDHQQISMMSTNAVMTNLRCDPALDTDLTNCKAEISLRGDFDGMCDKEVGIRCFPPSWSGIRLGAGAEVSTLEHVTIQKAGMFDYASYALKPALQIDFNRHLLTSLVVKSNSDSGLGILWNDVIGRHFNELAIVDSKFLNNEQHGIELRSRGLTLNGCTMGTNRQNGLEYNPTFSQKELDDLLSWLHTPKNVDNIVTLTFPLKTNFFAVPSSEDSYRYFIIQKHQQSDLRQSFSIGTDSGHMLSIHLLNPIHSESTEQLNMSLGLTPESPNWNLRLNTTSFPMVSPGYKFHFNYSSGSRPMGNIVLYIRSRYNNRDLKVLTKFIPSYLVAPKFDQTAANINSKLINSIVLTNCTISRNGIGLKFKNPNYFYGPNAVYQRRYANETTNITNCIVENNHFSAIFVSSDEFESGYNQEINKSLTTPSELYYNLIGNKIRRNKDGIRQFGYNIRLAHNVFHWTINETSFEQNRGGGIHLVLPYFWRYDTNLSHTLDISNNNFSKNLNFELGIGGHFAKLIFNGNIFNENRCRNKLISLSGMEKQMLFKHNSIEYNVCNRIIDFSISSHADKMGSVTANFEYNSIRNNRRSISNLTFANMASNFKYASLLSKLHPQATDYALGLKGVQAVNISRNLFVNPELRFELVVAIIMDSDERTVNAAENFWGSVLIGDISDKIFDFDDWNSYALAEVNPFLIQEKFTASTMFAEQRDLIIHPASLKHLGGRLMKSMTLLQRKESYIVDSDLTIMPNVRLTIEKGVVLEFMPNVGILVLGDLIATGTREKPIQFRPLLTATDVFPFRHYLYPANTRPNITQSTLADPLSYEHNYASKHLRIAYPVDMGAVRLCKNEICNDGSHIYENNIEDQTLRQEVLYSSNNTWKMDGFLEIFNMTTLQWVPVCDPLFTEHTARVVCRQLGYTHLTLFKRGRRYTIEQEQISSIRNWPNSLQCDGDESSLSSCSLAATGYMNHSAACFRESNQFVYIYCRDFPESSTISEQNNHGPSSELLNHWGGIRFSCPSGPSTTNGMSDDTINSINSTIYQGRSRLQYVAIERAGMLHRNKAPAIQVFQCNVPIEFTSVSNSAHHGIELITSQGNQNFHQLRLKNNIGVGLNYLSLTGSSSAARLVPYLPLKRLDISSDTFGLIDVCGANKEIRIEDRLLLFFKYSSRPLDCVKIITSSLNVKHLGIRMLQFDMMNSTTYMQIPDYVMIYDGSIFDRDSRLIVEFGVGERHRVERPEFKFYQTTDSTMTVRVHSSGSSPLFGFIAEVVTTPISYNIQRDTYNNMTFLEMNNNKLGALTVLSAGESTPNIIIKNNRYEMNCMHLFGNFTSCVSPIYMELQNCQRLKIINNLIRGNQGGIMLKSYSHTAVSALEAWIESNVIEYNHNTNALAILGPKTDPYQTVKVIGNFFTRNIASYLSNIVLSRIVANFSRNIVSGNIGKNQIEVVGFNKLPLSHQTFTNNWIYNNTATFERDRSTIFGNSAGQKYSMNYLVNPDNYFEISTMNWSRYDVKPLHVPRDDEIIHLASGDGSSKDVFRKTADAIPLNIIDLKKNELYHATINAKNNWWGFNTTTAIQSRIRDRVQHEELIKVDFAPFLEANQTVLSGICAGGWQKVGNACLVYVGTRMNYQEARDFCDRERATLPLLRGNHYEFSDFVASQDRGYDSKVDRIWVRSFDVSREACPAINDYRTKKYDCQDRNSFLCEKDPQIFVSLFHWHQETGGVIALIIAVITFILTICCSVCWGYKARHQHREKIERKNSLYASMRSNRGGLGYSTNNSLSELFLHRQLYSGEKSSITNLSLSTQLTQPSNDEPSLIRLDPAGNTASASIKKHFPNGRVDTSQEQQQQHQQNLTNYDRTRTFYEPQHQPAINPAYISPIPTISHQHHQGQVSTPTPSYKEMHPGALKGSKAPSYSGSNSSRILTDPMPNQQPIQPNRNVYKQPSPISFQESVRDYIPNRGLSPLAPQPQHPPPISTYDTPNQSNQQPNFSYQYSNIGNVSNNPNGRFGNIQAEQNSNYNQQSMRQQQQQQYQDVDGSGSSVPTYYSNQIETFEESTDSYLEAYNIYNETYSNVFQRMSQDQNSYNMIERSSITDLVMNPSPYAQAIDEDGNLVGLKSLDIPDTAFRYTNKGDDDNNTTTDHRHTFTSYKASSEMSSQSNRYCMETSFGTDAPTVAATSMFDGSQRLSPVSSSFGPTDSKSGSRVYLETSFE